MIRRLFATAAVLSALAALPALAQADFGLAPGKLKITAENSDETIDTQASSHPYALNVSFQFEDRPLFGGNKGLVILSSGFCAHPDAAVRFVGHNGAEYRATPAVRGRCPKGGRRKKGDKHGAR